MAVPLPPACPVCAAPAPQPLLAVEQRRYWRCSTCEARFLDPAQHLGPAAELAHYRTHQNRPDDPRYRRFLTRLAAPMLARLARPSRVLDYGCGPGPALATMLAAAGHEVSLYDPFFQAKAKVLDRQYDAVTCTEVIEHFHRPAEEFERLDRLLRPGGLLGLMTCFQTDDARFRDWHYRRDPTHVVFYREATLRWLAARRGWRIEVPAKDVAILEKPPFDEGRAG